MFSPTYVLIIELRWPHGSVADETPAERMGELIDVTRVCEDVAEACRLDRNTR